MTKATREALERVDQVLHEAGWDQSSDELRPISPEDVARLRRAYEMILLDDHLTMIQATLGKGLSVEKAGEQMGLTADRASQLFREAIHRLKDFASTCDN